MGTYVCKCVRTYVNGCVGRYVRMSMDVYVGVYICKSGQS